MDHTTLAAVVAEWLGGVMVGVFVFILWRSQLSQNSAVDLSSLILDKGIVTLAKFGGLLALLTSTWLVVYLALDKALTDVIFGSYVVGWGGVKIAADITSKQTEPLVTTETVKTERKQEVTKPKPRGR